MAGRVLGRRVPALDAVEKVTGDLRFTADLRLPGMLHACILRSPYPHARIVGIDVTRAECLPGVRAVITSRDLPPKRIGKIVKDEWCLARDKVTFVGEPVAAVAAEDERTAQDALELIDVDYEELPAVHDAIEGRSRGAPLVHETPETYEYSASQWGQAWGSMWFEIRGNEGNVCSTFKLRSGDVDTGFAASDLVIEETYHHPMVHHAALETHAAIARVDAGGQITVWTGNQSVYPLRDMLAEYFEVPASRVRVVGVKMGGAWGAKIDPTLEPICIALSRKVGRPVKIVLTRAEEFAAVGGRRPAWFRVKTGMMRDGRLVAREVEQTWTAGHRSGGVGAHVGHWGYVGAGPYRIANVKVDSHLVYTNQVAPRAFRGLGTPQIAWAIERHTDSLARAVDMDPVEFRLANCYVDGDRAPWGEVLEGVTLKETLLEAAKAVGWGGSADRGRGKGVALGWKWTAGGTFSRAQVTVNEDGSVTVITGLPDLGQGTETVLAQVAAETLGVALEDVKVAVGDSDLPANDMGAFSSRGASHTGNAVKEAADEARRKLFALAALVMGAPPDELDLKDGRVRHAAGSEVPLRAVLAGHGSVTGEGFFRGPKASRYDPETGATDRVCAEWKYWASAADLGVDVETGVVTLHKAVSVHDVGRALNPQLVEGQIIGGMAQAVGAALLEHVVFDHGRIANPSFMHYLLPTADSVPRELEAIMLESGTGVGPGGAKGIGEPSVVALGPAIGNALLDAVGVSIRDLPITPEKVLAGLDDEAAREG